MSSCFLLIKRREPYVNKFKSKMKIQFYHLASEDDAESVLWHETDGVDGEEAADLTEESELAELPEGHVQGRGQGKAENLKFFKKKNYFP